MSSITPSSYPYKVVSSELQELTRLVHTLPLTSSEMRVNAILTKLNTLIRDENPILAGMKNDLHLVNSSDPKTARRPRHMLIEGCTVLKFWNINKGNRSTDIDELHHLIANDQLDTLKERTKELEIDPLYISGNGPKFVMRPQIEGVTNFMVMGVSLAAYHGSEKVMKWFLTELNGNPNSGSILMQPKFLPACLSAALSPNLTEARKIKLLGDLKEFGANPLTRNLNERWWLELLTETNSMTPRVMHELMKLSADNFDNDAYSIPGDLQSTSILGNIYEILNENYKNPNFFSREINDPTTVDMPALKEAFASWQTSFLTAITVLIYHGIELTNRRCVELDILSTYLRGNFQVANKELKATKAVKIRTEERANLLRMIEKADPSLKQNEGYIKMARTIQTCILTVKTPTAEVLGKVPFRFVQIIMDYSFSSSPAARVLVAQNCFDRTFKEPIKPIEAIKHFQDILELADKDLYKARRKLKEVIDSSDFKNSLKKLRLDTFSLVNGAVKEMLDTKYNLARFIDNCNMIIAAMTWNDKEHIQAALNAAIRKDDLVEVQNIAQTYSLDPHTVIANPHRPHIFIPKMIKGIDRNAFFLSGLSLAAYYGAEKVATWLLKDCKVSPNFANSKLNTCILPAWLALAVSPLPLPKKLKILEELKKYGVNPFLKDMNGDLWLSRIVSTSQIHPAYLRELLSEATIDKEWALQQSSKDTTAPLLKTLERESESNIKLLGGSPPTLIHQMQESYFKTVTTLIFTGFNISEEDALRMDEKHKTSFSLLDAFRSKQNRTDYLERKYTVLRNEDQQSLISYIYGLFFPSNTQSEQDQITKQRAVIKALYVHFVPLIRDYLGVISSGEMAKKTFNTCYKAIHLNCNNVLRNRGAALCFEGTVSAPSSDHHQNPEIWNEKE